MGNKSSNKKYSDEQRETMIRLFRDERLSATKIANRFGLTRSQVLGVVHRAGVTVNHNKTRQSKPAPRVPRSPSRPKQKLVMVAVEEALSAGLDEPPPGCQPLLRRNDRGQLEANPAMHDRACRYPSGDPIKNPACFCAKQTVAPFPYCLFHLHIVYPTKQLPEHVVNEVKEKQDEVGAVHRALEPQLP